MKYVVLILFLFPMIVVSQELKNWKWQKRIIVIEAASLSDEEMQEQLTLLTSVKNEWDAYKLLIIERSNAGYRINLGKVEPREEREPVEGFKVYLIGLDGGIKFTSDKVQAAQKFFELIDAMPMHRNSIKKGG